MRLPRQPYLNVQINPISLLLIHRLLRLSNMHEPFSHQPAQIKRVSERNPNQSLCYWYLLPSRTGPRTAAPRTSNNGMSPPPGQEPFRGHHSHTLLPPFRCLDIAIFFSSFLLLRLRCGITCLNNFFFFNLSQKIFK